MDAAGIAYEELLAEDNVELAQRYRIMQAPTLLEVGAADLLVRFHRGRPVWRVYPRQRR